MIDGINLFDQPVNSMSKYMKILERLLLVKEMITQLFLFQRKLHNNCNRSKQTAGTRC